MSPSAITALVAVRELAKGHGTTIIHNLITSRAVPEIVREHGGEPVRTRVGHSFIKAEMARTDAIFGGEHSAHYYFRDFWGADNGMLAAMHLLAEFGAQELPLSRFAEHFNPYFQSGEINSTVTDVPAAYARIVTEFASQGSFDELDGLTVTSTNTSPEEFWWFNVRPSNTEPLLRLNAEAGNPAQLEAIRDQVLALIRQ